MRISVFTISSVAAVVATFVLGFQNCDKIKSTVKGPVTANAESSAPICEAGTVAPCNAPEGVAGHRICDSKRIQWSACIPNGH